MKIEWQNVIEITLGVIFAGAVLITLNAFFGDWLKEQGQKIMKG